ncbi:energy transducer TonB [Thermodesulfatator atlanticus]|uniref:energy transducer TonB n=1 Tax=Thermodesulfatator atlanticus TaxID=501497 RepID=UPI0003B66B61|nr:energy transducer TonB [Thermodesulfatator atlanticus]
MKTTNWTTALFFSLFIHLAFFTGLMLANRPYTPKENIIRLNLKSIALPSPSETKTKAAQIKKKLTPQTKEVSQKIQPKPQKKKIVAQKTVKKHLTSKTPAKKQKTLKARKAPKKAPVKKASSPPKRELNEEKLLAQRLAALKAKAEEKRLAEKISALKKAEETSPGGLSLGDGISAELTRRLAAHIMNFWAVPEILRDKPDLSAEVEIEIAPSGRIISWRFLRRSGEPLFDEAVAATLKRANPLPAPGKYLKLPAIFKMK